MKRARRSGRARSAARGADLLPPLYQRWMTALLGGPLPEETAATCHDCAMCAKPGDNPAAGTYFDPRVKCCTYLPELHNFLVGRVLADASPEAARGRATLEARLASGSVVTPLGLGVPRAHAVKYQEGASQTFGHSLAMRCPHYLEEDGGRCGVWRHRNAVCATWFCKHVRGAVGLGFARTLLQVLSTVEKSLARWCVARLELGDDALARLFPPPRQGHAATPLGVGFEGAIEPEDRRALWGRWLGRERAFFLECARRVSALSWPEVVALSGPELELESRLCRAAYRRLRSTRVEWPLAVGNLDLQNLGREGAHAVSYLDTNPLELPAAVLEVLPYFDGRPKRTVLAAIRRDKGVEVADDLVRRLCDFEVLVPAERLLRRR